MKVAAFLPAKGSSNRIPNKNIMLLDGEPLFLRSLKKLMSISLIDEVFLDTESHEIIDLASEVKCNILKRDASLASNKTDGNLLFYNEVQHSDADICVQLLCTSPFIKPSTIEKGINILLDNPEYDSVVAIRKEKQYLWKDGRPVYNIHHIPNSVDLEDTIIESMGLYIVRRDVALQLKRRIGDNPFLLEIDPTESIDVNWPEDFELANLIAIGLREQERRLFNNLKLLLSSGLPIVTTSIGAEGMGIENEIHAFVSDDAKQFADYVIKLYNSENLWNKFSEFGKKLVEQQYSGTLMRKRLEYIFNHTKRDLSNHLTLYFSSPPEVSIVLVLYNQLEYTTKCLSSIKSRVKCNYEIIVIDNASTDGTHDYFKKEVNYVRYFRNRENIGFPAAVNQAINKALGDYILFLNNDTVLTDNLVERLIEVTKSDSGIGIVGPISNEVSGLQKDKNAKYNSIEDMHKYAAEVQQKNKDEIIHFPRVAFLCTLIKREVIDKIGGLDERFSPGNYEDDFCLRAQLAGYKTVIAKDVFIHHYGSKSFKANGEKAYAERLLKNQKIFVEKWGATPDEIWLQNKTIKPHQIFYPIDENKFLQFFRRVKVHLADNEIQLAQDAIEQAINFYSEGSAKIISKTNLLNLAGNLFLASNDFDKAQYYFEQELQHSPSSTSACFGLGQVFYAKEQFDAARVMFEWAVKNDPNNSQAVVALNNVNEILGIKESVQTEMNQK